MNEAIWPIRIGGEYKAQTDGLFRRVTEIDGDTIHSELVYAKDGDVLAREKKSSWLFRACSHPEDQSPIPALVEALNIVIKRFSSPEDLVTIFGMDDAFTICTAISKAEGTYSEILAAVEAKKAGVSQ